MKIERRGKLYLATHGGRLALADTRTEAMMDILRPIVAERLHAATAKPKTTTATTESA